MQFILNSDNLRNYILTTISQERIFAYYLGIDVKDIEYCLIRKQNRICNPLRNDIDPSLGFNYYRNKLYMYDFASASYRGDVFYIVGLLHGFNSRSSKDFVKICRTIIDNVILNKIKDDNTIKSFVNLVEHIDNNNKIRVIKVETREWDKEDKKIWNKWKISISDLDSNYVYPVESFWIDKDYYKPYDKCYAYLLGKIEDITLWEIYFPLRNKKGKYPKFITNNTKHVNCIWELHKTKNLILTKSRKDVIVLKNILNSNPFEFSNLFSVTHLGSETTRLNEKEAELLNNLYDNVYMFTDFDREGVSCANYHKRKYNFKTMFLTNGRFNTTDYYSKDISDYVNLLGFKQGCNLMKSLMNK